VAVQFFDGGYEAEGFLLPSRGSGIDGFALLFHSSYFFCRS